jgi:hypothetical protein
MAFGLTLGVLEPDPYKAGVSQFEPVLSLELIVYVSKFIRRPLLVISGKDWFESDTKYWIMLLVPGSVRSA